MAVAWVLLQPRGPQDPPLVFRGVVRAEPVTGSAATLGAVTGSGGRAVRQLRAAVATLVVVGLGASAHSVGGGSSLQLVPATVLTLLVAPLVWILLRSRTSLPRMVLAIGSGQVVTHVTLAAMAPATGGTATPAHAHGAVALSAAGPDLPAALHLSGPMLLAHLAATVLAGVLLTRGEDVVRVVARWFCTRIPAAPVLGVTAVPTVVVGRSRGFSGRAVRPVGGRGPPLHTC